MCPEFWNSQIPKCKIRLNLNLSAALFNPASQGVKTPRLDLIWFIVQRGVLYWDFQHWEQNVSPHAKNDDDFSRVWGGQSTAGTSLALFSTKSEWLRVLFFKSERSRLFFVTMVAWRYGVCLRVLNSQNLWSEPSMTKLLPFFSGRGSRKTRIRYENAQRNPWS